MHLPKKPVIFFLTIVVVITCSSWGYLVHKTSMQLAVYKLPKAIQPFFYKNMDYLVENAGRPDKRRNTDSTEAPKHFIDLEKFGENAAYKMPFKWDDAVSKYSLDTLKTYGYVPYEIMFMKQQLTAAFKTGNADSILFYATDMGHYIGDANVPLHTTENYDGQLTDQVGIHSLWETMIPEIEISNFNLYDKHKATYLAKPAERIWKAIRKANALVPEMLAAEKMVTLQFTPDKKYRTQIRRGKEVKYYTSDFAKAYSKALGNTVNEQLLSTSDMIADFWYTAWVDAGKPALDIALSEDEAAAIQTEKEFFKKNQLIENNLLRSQKEVPKKEE
ncbi:hypothetical protein BH11BAC3_BH11BAC3_47910 [soil metagenome]